LINLVTCTNPLWEWFFTEIQKEKQLEFEAEVQGIINVVTRHIGEAMERGVFSVEIYEKVMTDDQSIIAMAMASGKDNGPTVAGTKNVILEAIRVLKDHAGFKISMFKENETHALPYFTVEWEDPDDDSTK
jgi:hypothetical protein